VINYRKIRKNVKAVSPVISVLLMIVVAVAASLVTYAWVMGYLGFTTNKVGKAIMIQSVAIIT
jgi:flagellin-like protein